MGILHRFHRWFTVADHAVPLIEKTRWQPIASAPSGERILLGWSDGNDEYDWLIAAGELVDGRWIEGPGPQPDWWMSEPDFSRRKPISTAPDDETLALIWEDEDCYDFDVGELSGGLWPDGPVQPTGWIPISRPPRTGEQFKETMEGASR